MFKSATSHSKQASRPKRSINPRGAPALYRHYDTAFGSALIASRDTGLCFLGFDDPSRPEESALADALHRSGAANLHELAPHTKATGISVPAHTQLHTQALAYIEALAKGAVSAQAQGLPLPPLCPQGTPFQQAVWRALADTLPGECLSYTELAARMGYNPPQRMARAVGNAVAANPLAILIPCHRVLPQQGGIGGYRWGAERKRQILHAERGAKIAK